MLTIHFMQTDHTPMAKPQSRISHAFPLWDRRRAFCGVEFFAGEAVETDRTTCKTCLQELAKIRKNKL